MAQEQWPLAVHVVMHGYQPDPTLRRPIDQIELFADRLCERLSNSERAPSIPVRLWRRTGQKLELSPRRVPLELAAKNLIIVIVDQAFFEARVEWDSYVSNIINESKDRGDLVIPIAVHADAARVSSAFGDVNHLFVQDPIPFADDEGIYQAIFTALLRLLVDDLPRVFLCHAKVNEGPDSYGEGERIARSIRQYIYEKTQLSCFFDLHDIPHGQGVKRSIETAISQSVVLAVWTDKLLDSPWCQFELIEARRQQRPMLVLDALTSKTPRLFPFLGNMPVMRWQDNAPNVVSGILLELLRTHHLRAVFDTLCLQEPCPPSFGLHPPDLLDSAMATASASDDESARSELSTVSRLFVYPDPPIKPNELDVLQSIDSSRRFLSLVEWRSLRAADALQAVWEVSSEPRYAPLSGKRVGISVSASDTWAEMGLIGQHQDGLASDTALDLILLGVKVIWGGDLRPDGLGHQLKHIVQTYQHPSHPPQAHVGLVVPFSPDVKRSLNLEALQARRLFADVQMLKCPLSKGQDDIAAIKPGSDEAVALSALALSVMRAGMARECDARILLGGGLRKFAGIYPGIAEEAYEAVRSQSPIYILGGFGGAAKAVYETVVNLGSGRQTLIDACLAGGAAANSGAIAEHRRMVSELERPQLKFDPDAMVDTFSNLGMDGVSARNGLDASENERLALSQNVHEILELLVKGLCAVSSRQSSVRETRPHM